MSKRKVVLTAAGTITCAMAIGFLMQQTGEAPGQSATTLAPVPIEQAVLDGIQNVRLEEITLISANLGPDLGGILSDVVPEPKTVSLDSDIAEAIPPSDPEVPRLGCDIHIQARPTAMAQVLLSLRAPCNGNERATIHHNGLMFTEVTNLEGALDVTIPALSEKAVFVIELDGGAGAVAVADVPSLHEFDRVALQWTGDVGFQMHAREFGAAYGESGHVWSGQAATDESAGHMTRLGVADTFNPRLVEVYTFARSASERSGIVALTIEAEVTEANCGRDIAAQSLELRSDASLRTQDLVLSMPECSAKGDFLVLNNLVDDLKIASN